MTFLGTHHSDFSQASSQCHEVFVAWPPCHMNCKRWQRAMQSAAFGWIQWPKKSLAQSFRIGGWTWVAVFCGIWVWVNTYENTIFRGMNIHFNPAILMWTTGVLLVLTHCHMAFQETSPWPKKTKRFCLTTKTGQLPGQASWHEMLVQTVSGDGSREAWARFLLHKTRTSERCQSLGQILIVQCYSTWIYIYIYFSFFFTWPGYVSIHLLSCWVTSYLRLAMIGPVESCEKAPLWNA